jgi:AcrR family transcriptional regulator
MPKAAVKPAKQSLSPERIETAALELIEAEGLDGFSTRKLAARLGYEAMSIYHYFPSKGHLMDALVNRVVRDELTVLSPGAGEWRAQLEKSAWEWRAMALKHRALFVFLANHRLNTPTALRWLNGVIAVMTHTGLEHELAVRLFRTIGYYLNGAMLDETAGYTRGPSTVEPVPEDVMARDYPEVVRAGRWFAEAERQKTFEVGLKILFDGIGAEVARARR